MCEGVLNSYNEHKHLDTLHNIKLKHSFVLKRQLTNLPEEVVSCIHKFYAYCYARAYSMNIY